jgi:TolB protein
MFTLFPLSFKRLGRLAAAVLAFGLAVPAAQAQRDLGDLEVKTDLKVTPVRVSATAPQLDRAARRLFSLHGAFRLQDEGAAFRIEFAPGASPNEVQVRVLRAGGGAPVLAQAATGAQPGEALAKAADLAVRALSGQPGFFASRLAFVGERGGKREVFVSDLLLDNVVQLTRDNSLAVTPRWSPDGRRLLYTSYHRTGFPDIFQIDLAGNKRDVFASFRGTNMGARFSPDGRNVVMVLSSPGNPEIFVSNAQGRGVTRKTQTSAIESSPSFSPDGSQLVFTSDAAGGPQLYLMPAAGGTARRLPTRISGYCAEPDWSRAAPHRIAYTVRSGRGYQIAVHDLKTNESKLVSSASADAIEPSWLADGRHLVFTQRSANASALWVLDTETKRAVALSSAAAGQVSQASVLDPR